MQKLEGRTFNVVQDNIEKLKNLFPDVFTENKVDIDKLRIVLGEHVEKDKERYEFTWNGKTEAIQLAQKQTTGTLRPCKDESVNWDTTQNLYIEGDNLEVLRILQSSYRNKVKMIYIDPPYNTGKDFIYKDDFHNNVKNYIERLSENMKSNAETQGRFHTDWLNLMYPRLKLARNLLTTDGVIFISIDDHEVHNLRKICDEIFGDENFVAEIAWEKVHTRKNSAKYFSDSHEYVLCYAKNKQNWNRNLIPRENTDNYSNPDNDPKGPWKSDPIYANNPYEADYEIKKPTGISLKRPQGKYWRYSEETIKKAIEEKRILWGVGDSYPTLKRYLSEVQDGLVPVTLFNREFAGDNAYGNNELKSVFGIDKLFPYPKPTKLIERLLQIGSDENSIIMDFFSGAGSTAHAILKQNAENKGNRRFILVQIPDPTNEKSDAYKAGYSNICEIGKERIRRVGKKILEETQTKEPSIEVDVGFKVFRLADSNLKMWDGESLDVEKSLLDFVEPVKEGRTQKDVVYEVLLKYGVDLTVPIEELSIVGKTSYSVGMGYLFICLEHNLTLEQIEEIAKHKPSRVVFYDEGFKNDTIRTNAQQILKRYGVEDIRVI
ncbi:site-specific DNA-methyltransferase [Peribacillus frigoritolerans]|uniref:site-specific DNA-methyltransferase n=1 Tax=Peribacillus frigoritolerans TaxID=450367 RepID=UPI003632096E